MTSSSESSSDFVADLTKSINEDQSAVKRSTIPGRNHRTWAGTFACVPDRYLQPASITDVQSIVREAHRLNKRIMLTGSGHSPSVLTMTQPRTSSASAGEWIVNLDKFNKPISVTPASVDGPGTLPKDARYTDVKVEAGMRIYQINEYLKEHGLAVQNLGSISEQSVAGIISTGTHGSSALHGLVSQQIVSLDVVIGSGEIVHCSETENVSLFRASLLSLGKIGLIVYATLRTVPAYTIHSKLEVVAFDRFVNEIWPTFWTSSEYLRVWWFPYTNRCILWRANKSVKPLSAPRESWYGTTLGRFFYQSLLWLAVKINPGWTPAIERFIFDKQYGMTETYNVEGAASEAVQGSVEGLNMDCLFSQFVDEWGLPLREGQRVLKELHAVITKAANDGKYYVHSPIEVRCSNLTTVDPKDSHETTLKLLDRVPKYNHEKPHIGSIPGNSLAPFLNPSPNGIPYAAPIPGEPKPENLTLYLNATMYRPFGFNSPIDKWFRDFEDLVGEAGGKPHWAKNFLGEKKLTVEETESVQKEMGEDGYMRGLEPQVSTWFGEDLNAWKRTRLENDPSNVFLSGENWAKINGLL